MSSVRPDQPEETRGGRAWLAVAGAFVFIALGCWISALTLPYRHRVINADRPPPRRVNVVIFLIDTLRADRLGAYGYPRPTSPNIDALAAESTLFSQCYAPAPWTLPSVTSLMTSTFPCEHGVVLDGQRVGDSLMPLAQRLSQAGYSTASFYANPYAGPMTGLDRGFDQCTFHQATDGAVVNEWLSTSKAAPFFAYIHNIEPHNPFVAPARLVSQFGTVSEEHKRTIGERLLRYRQLTRVDFAAGRPVGTTDNTAEQEEAIREIAEYADEINELYDAAVRLADERVGSVINALKDRGVWDNTLFILVSDHGEELFDHGGWQHDQSVYEELVHVPLIVHFPNGSVSPRVVDRVVSLVDVAPTILDYLGQRDALSECRGGSLLPMIESAGGAAHGQTMPQTSAMTVPSLRVNRKKYFRPYRDSRGDINMVVRDGSYKGIYNADLKMMELYDLRLDAAEKRDVSSEHERRVGAMTKFATEWFRACVRRGASRGGDAASQHLDEAVRDRLRSLGYVE